MRIVDKITIDKSFDLVPEACRHSEWQTRGLENRLREYFIEKNGRILKLQTPIVLNMQLVTSNPTPKGSDKKSRNNNKTKIFFNEGLTCVIGIYCYDISQDNQGGDKIDELTLHIKSGYVQRVIIGELPCVSCIEDEWKFIGFCEET